MIRAALGYERGPHCRGDRPGAERRTSRLVPRVALLLIGASTLLLVSACARSPQRLDVVALNGQPVAQAVIDQRECEAEFPFTREESTLQAYASCLLARGYVSEVPLSASSGTRRITVYVRPDRPGRGPSEIRRHIVDCQSVMQQAYRQVSFGYALARELVSSRTFGGNMQRRELIATFATCMSHESYAVGDERHDVVPNIPLPRP